MGQVRREKKVIVFEVQGAVFAYKLQGERDKCYLKKNLKIKETEQYLMYPFRSLITGKLDYN